MCTCKLSPTHLHTHTHTLDLSLKVRELRKIISATELELHEIQLGFPSHGEQRPSLVIEEEVALFGRLQELRRRERYLTSNNRESERVPVCECVSYNMCIEHQYVQCSLIAVLTHGSTIH